MNEEEVISCSICRESNADCDFRTRCSHNFHSECLKEWIDKGHKMCPLCRVPISKVQLLEDFVGKRISEEEILELDQKDPETINFVLDYMHEYNRGNGFPLVKRLIEEKGFDMNSEFAEGISIFDVVCDEFGIDEIKYFVEHGAKLSLNGGLNALNTACFCGNLDKAQYLIDSGADINHQYRGLSPLYTSCRLEKVECVKLLLERGAILEIAKENGETPLMVAAAVGNLEILKLLITRSSIKTTGGPPLNLNRTGDSGVSALQWAVEREHLEVVKYLVECGADIRTKDREGLGLMHAAAETGNLDVLKYLLEEVGLEVDEKDANGSTPLYLACATGHLETVKILIKSGANINHNAGDGVTPLKTAMFFLQFPIIDYMLKKGATYSMDWIVSVVKTELDSFLIKHGGGSVEKYAKNGQFTFYLDTTGISDLFRFLCRPKIDPQCDKYLAIFLATIIGDSDLVKAFIEISDVSLVDVVEDDEGFTPVFYACYHGYLDIVKYFVENGADIGRFSKNGTNPLHLASAGGQFQVLNYLLSIEDVEKKVDLNAKIGTAGMTLLHIACLYGSISIDTVKLLIEKGADVTIKNDEQENIIHITSKHKFSLDRTLQFLLDSSFSDVFDVNEPSNHGQTPLIYAVFAHSLDTVKYLVSKGADVNVRFGGPDFPPYSCLENTSLLLVAAILGNLEMVKFLVEKTSNVDVQDAEGSTPLRYAAALGDLEMVKLLLKLGANKYLKDVDGLDVIQEAEKHQQFLIAEYLKSTDKEDQETTSCFSCF